MSYRKLDVPGVDKLTGAGVYYGAAQSEAMYYKGEDIYIVGGANSAGQAAMYFSRYARNVSMLVRGNSLAKGMSQYLVAQIAATPNIHVLPQLKRQRGTRHGATRDYYHRKRHHRPDRHVPATALFIFIGAQPRTEWVVGTLERDDMGFILAGPDLMKDGERPKGWPLKRQPFWLEASVPGIFVAGDVRHHSVKRMASAVGEGSMAVQFIHQYLSSL